MDPILCNIQSLPSELQAIIWEYFWSKYFMAIIEKRMAKNRSDDPYYIHSESFEILYIKIYLDTVCPIMSSYAVNMFMKSYSVLDKELDNLISVELETYLKDIYIDEDVYEYLMNVYALILFGKTPKHSIIVFHYDNKYDDGYTDIQYIIHTMVRDIYSTGSINISKYIDDMAAHKINSYIVKDNIVNCNVQIKMCSIYSPYSFLHDSSFLHKLFINDMQKDQYTSTLYNMTILKDVRNNLKYSDFKHVFTSNPCVKNRTVIIPYKSVILPGSDARLSNPFRYPNLRPRKYILDSPQIAISASIFFKMLWHRYKKLCTKSIYSATDLPIPDMIKPELFNDDYLDALDAQMAS